MPEEDAPVHGFEVPAVVKALARGCPVVVDP
jgi:hypothetical protein